MPEIWVRRLGWLASLALVFLSAAALRANAQSAPLPPTPGGQSGASAAAPKLWLGLLSTPADETLRSHLQLAKDQGLVVRDVVADSPASAAGLHVHDVLLTLAETSLSSPEQLTQLVEAQGTKELELQYIRAGQRGVAKITPAVRPVEPAADPASATAEFPLDDAVQKQLAEALEIWARKAAKTETTRRVGFHVIRPGVIETGHLDVSCPTRILPEDLKVRVEYNGAKSPKIEVFRGKDRWQATADNLDPLPADLRMYAWQLTQPSVMYVPRERFPGTVEILAPGDAGQSAAPPTPPGPIANPQGGTNLPVAPTPPYLADDALKLRLEQLSREIANLRNSVDKLVSAGEKKEE
jgi:hypothetical protein